ncbi:MAG: MupG family TIM beta-alpha barrel fold protein, partial [Erysipelotrichaceae bacterium]
MNKFGISLYLSTGYNTNKSIIEKAILNGASYAFTSLQIPEENINNYNIEVNKLLELCNNKINIIVDISPETLTKLNINNYDELKALGITHIRLDYGFSYDQIIELTKLFNIVFNASTFSEQDYKELKVRKANFKSF